MPAGRVLATQQAKDAAKQLLALTGTVKEHVGRVLQQGSILADPHRWDGGHAGKWRNEWSKDATQLNQTTAKLDELERRAQQVIDDIFKSDSGLPGPVAPASKPVDTRPEADNSDTENPWLKEIHSIESVHAPWDLIAGDSVLSAAAKQSERSLEALDTFLHPWLDSTRLLQAAGPYLEGFSRFSGAVGVIGDIGTFMAPEDHGAMATVDRGMAVANAAGFTASLVTANAAADWIPGVGEGVAIGTGVYLAGDWAYHNWPWFHDACNAVGHVTVTVAKDVWDGISSGASSVVHFFGL
jgi:hypothetical protein